MPKFVCEHCGPITEVEFDGYGFGERILEGVMFIGTLSPDGKILSVKVRDIDADYFSDLNQKKWLKEAKTYLGETDVVTCVKCQRECGPE